MRPWLFAGLIILAGAAAAHADVQRYVAVATADQTDEDGVFFAAGTVVHEFVWDPANLWTPPWPNVRVAPDAVTPVGQRPAAP